MYSYIEADELNVGRWIDLDLKLFPDHLFDQVKDDCYAILASKNQSAFLCIDSDGRSIGFVQVSLRTDYVEGSESSPVGYIEAIYVEPEFRRQGVAQELVRMAERWAVQKGCCEMGSDTEIINLESQAFHKGTGFHEANRIVAYIKKIAVSE